MTAPLEQRFWSKVSRTSEHGCWMWIGAGSSGLGYGSIGEDQTGRTLLAHRVAYQLSVGPIPQGMTIDHLCRVKLCVNPKHLELVTMAENLRRGDGASSINARKTHCPKGHEYTPENTRLGTVVRSGHSRTSRHCRACRK